MAYAYLVVGMHYRNIGPEEDPCCVCRKALSDQIGPTITDNTGNRYHFQCWRRQVNSGTETPDTTEQSRKLATSDLPSNDLSADYPR